MISLMFATYLICDVCFMYICLLSHVCHMSSGISRGGGFKPPEIRKAVQNSA